MDCIAAYTVTKVKPDAKFTFYGIFCLLFLFLVLTKYRSATGAVPAVLGIVWFASQSIRKIFIGTLLGSWFLSMIVLICVVSDFNPITANQEVLLLGRGEERGLH